MSEQNPYQTTNERVAYQTPFMTIMEHSIIHPDGQPGVYSFMSLPGAVVIVPVTEDNQIYMVKLWRYPINKFSWEIPMGGLLDKDEQPLVAAKRELLEEAGLVANRWDEVIKNYPYSSSSNEMVTVYLARDLALQPFTDTNEISEVRAFPIETVMQMIDAGEVSNGEAINGILLAQRFMRKHEAVESSK